MFFSQGVFVVVVVAFSFAVQLNSRNVTKSFFLNLRLSLLFFNLILWLFGACQFKWRGRQQLHSKPPVLYLPPPPCDIYTVYIYWFDVTACCVNSESRPQHWMPCDAFHVFAALKTPRPFWQIDPNYHLKRNLLFVAAMVTHRKLVRKRSVSGLREWTFQLGGVTLGPNVNPYHCARTPPPSTLATQH